MPLMLGNISIHVMTVTPDIASQWLQRNTVNRRLRQQTVEMYAREMLNGRWHLKPLAICFLADGSLGNGQHTLSAIASSGQSQRMLIADGCSKDQVAAMDVGLRRSVADLLHFFESPTSRVSMSIARLLQFGPNDRKQKSFEELRWAYEENQTAIEGIVALAESRNLIKTPAAVLAALARAYPHIQEEVMSRFLDVFASGIASGSVESSAIRLRDYVRATNHSASTNQITWEKTISAIDAFAAGRPLQKIYGTTKDIFPSRASSAAL